MSVVLVTAVIVIGLSGLWLGERPATVGFAALLLATVICIPGYFLAANLSAITIFFLVAATALRWTAPGQPEALATPAVDPAIPALAQRRLHQLAAAEARCGQLVPAWRS